MTDDLFVVVVSVVRVAYVSVDAFDVPPVDMLLVEPYPGVLYCFFVATPQLLQ